MAIKIWWNAFSSKERITDGGQRFMLLIISDPQDHVERGSYRSAVIEAVGVEQAAERIVIIHTVF